MLGGIRRRGGRRSAVAAALALLAALVAALAGSGSGASAAGAGPVNWGPPVSVDGQPPFAFPNSITGLSCPTTALCVAVTSFGAVAASTAPQTGPWSNTTLGSVPLYVSAVSCAIVSATPHCVAGGTDSLGDDLLFRSSQPTGGSGAWTQDVLSGGGGVTAAQCLSTGACFAVDRKGNVLAFYSGHWHISNSPIDPTSPFVSLACFVRTSTANGCVALDNSGVAYESGAPETLTSTSWTAHNPGLPDGRGGVACVSSSYCVLASSTGAFSQMTSSATTIGNAAFSPALTASLSAPLACVGDAQLPGNQALCFTGEQGVSGLYESADGGQSFALQSFPAGTGTPTAVSCPTDQLCFAGTAAGDLTWASPSSDTATAWSNATWSPGQLVTQGGTNILLFSSTSCPSATLCAGSDFRGRVFVSTNPTGGVAAWSSSDVDGTNAIVGAPVCPSTTLCVASDNAGNIVTSINPASGPASFSVTAPHVSSSTIASLSCPSPAECVGADQSGDIVSSTNPSGAWNLATGTDPGSNSLSSLTCPSTALCVGADYVGNVLTSTNPTGGSGSWQAAAVDPGSNVRAMTCPGPMLCVGVDSNGRIVASTNPGGGPSTFTVSATAVTPNVVNPGNLTCPSTTLCVAVDVSGFILTSTNPAGGASAWNLTSTPIDAQFVQSVTCPSTTLCLAVDQAGNALETNNPTGGAGQWISVPVDAGANVLPTSCFSTALCLFSDLSGNVVAGIPAATTTTSSSTSTTAVGPAGSTTTSSSTASAVSPTAGAATTTTSAAATTTTTRTTSTTHTTSTPAPLPPGRATAAPPRVHGTTLSDRVRCAGRTGEHCVVTLALTIVETLRGSKITAVGARRRDVSHRTVVIASTTVTLLAGQARTIGLTVTGHSLLVNNPRFAARFTARQGSRRLGAQTVTIVAGRQVSRG